MHPSTFAHLYQLNRPLHFRTIPSTSPHGYRTDFSENITKMGDTGHDRRMSNVAEDTSQ